MNENEPLGSPMPESMQYETKVQDGKMIGFSDPNGAFHHLGHRRYLLHSRSTGISSLSYDGYDCGNRDDR